MWEEKTYVGEILNPLNIQFWVTIVYLSEIPARFEVLLKENLALTAALRVPAPLQLP